MEIITFLSVEVNFNRGVSTRVENLTSMDLQDRHVAESEGRKKTNKKTHYRIHVTMILQLLITQI